MAGTFFLKQMYKSIIPRAAGGGRAGLDAATGRDCETGRARGAREPLAGVGGRGPGCSARGRGRRAGSGASYAAEAATPPPLPSPALVPAPPRLLPRRVPAASASALLGLLLSIKAGPGRGDHPGKCGLVAASRSSWWPSLILLLLSPPPAAAD